MIRSALLIMMLATGLRAQDWHVNTEPIYFLVGSPNIALDRSITSSVALGFQYAPLEWGSRGKNLSGFQLFIAPSGQLTESTNLLKVYAGLLSSRTTLLKIEAKEHPEPLGEILYGHRWVFQRKWTVAVLAGTFFTKSRIYPSVSVPLGYLF